MLIKLFASFFSLLKLGSTNTKQRTQENLHDFVDRWKKDEIIPFGLLFFNEIKTERLVITNAKNLFILVFRRQDYFCFFELCVEKYEFF